MKNPFSAAWSAVQRANSSDCWNDMAYRQIACSPEQAAQKIQDPYQQIPIQRGVTRQRNAIASADLKDCLYWGGHWVPINTMQHTASLGSPRSGKTLHGSCTFASAVSAVLHHPGRKLIVFDTKGDYQSFLEGLRKQTGVPLYYQVLNISDLYASSWDIATDFNSYAKLYELGYLLFPEAKGENAFFQDASRAISIAVMMSFTYRHGTDWTLADLYNALTTDHTTLKAIIEGYPRGGDIVNLLLSTEAGETLDNIRMTIQSQVERLRIPAAHAQNTHAGSLSIRQFLESDRENILVIGQDLTERAISQPIVRAVFKRLIDSINGRPGVEIKPNTFVFLDELEFLDKLPGLLEAANFSRGKGLVLSVLSQTVEGLKRVYGKEAAETLLGACPFKALFRSDSAETEQWYQNLIGQIEVWETDWNTSFSAQGLNVSRSRKRKLIHPVLSSDVRRSPRPTFEDGLTGFFLSEEYGDELWKTLPSKELATLSPQSGEVSRLAVPQSAQIIRPWNEAEQAKYVSGTSRSHCDSPPTEHEAAEPLLSLFEEELRGEIFDLIQDRALPTIEAVLHKQQQQGL